MTTTISVRLDKEVLRDLTKVERKWQADRSEAIRRLLVHSIEEWKITTALQDIRERKISIGKAAEECGLSLWRLLDLLQEKNVDWTGYSAGDVERDLRLLEK